MGQRDTMIWDESSLIWGDHAEWARQQAQLHRKMIRENGRALIKAEQLAAFELSDNAQPSLALQYDLFQAKPSEVSIAPAKVLPQP